MLNDLQERIRHNLHTASHWARYYDEVWEQYNRPQVYESYDLGRVQFIEKVLARFAGRRDQAILDLGCGSGWLSDYLTAWGTVTGTDFSPKAIESTRQHYGNRIRFILADAESLRLNIPSDQLFDGVVCSEVSSAPGKP